MNKKQFSCELALILALIINSINICFLVKSNFGISTLSSVPLVISNILTNISFGTWTFIIQIFTIIIMIIIIRKIKIGYIGSFVISLVFGLLVDFISVLMTNLPIDLYYRIIYFIVGFIGLSLGAALFIRCRLPIMPFDLFVRDVSKSKKWKISIVKMTYDFICVAISLTLSLIFLNKVVGVGIGTLIGVLLTGLITQKFIKILDKYFVFKPTLKISKKIINVTEISFN